MKAVSVALLCMVCGMSTAQQSIKKLQTISTIASVGDRVFFSASEGEHGEELWLTDGTTEGTVLVKDINSGYYASNPTELTNFNGKLFFTATTAQFGPELWTSDGTAAGTVLVKDVTANVNANGPAFLKVFKNHLYFSALEGFYKSDGTAAGTVKIDDFDYYYVNSVKIGDNYLYYTTNSQYEFKRTDGTTVTTMAFPETDDGMYFHSLHTVGNKLFVVMASSYEQVIELYLYQENTSSWQLIKDYHAPIYGDQKITNFAPVGDRLFFNFRSEYENETPTDELWVTDGTINGTIKLRSTRWEYYTSNSAMDCFVNYKDALYFRAGSQDGNSLWKSDGTPEGTVKVHDVKVAGYTYSPYGLTQPVVSNGLLWFTGAYGQWSYDTELWRSDGTTEGTNLYADLKEDGSSDPTLLTNANDKTIYFTTKESSFASTLWNTSPSPKLVMETSGGVRVPHGILWNGLNDGQAQGCIKVPLVVHNIGYEPLALSDAVVTGTDFYLDGSLPEFLSPDEKVTIVLYFKPISAGTKSGEFFIRSNDPNTPRYLIKLGGSMTESQVKQICKDFDGDMTKIIKATPGEKTIKISKNLIEEKLPALSPVGTLSLPGSSEPVTYALVSGEGATDNNLFAIQGNHLVTARAFNYDIKNLYTVRIKATTSGSSVEEMFSIGIIDKTSSLVPEDCKTIFENLNYVLTDIEFNSAGVLFAITHDGRILRSTDEGINWMFLNHGNWGQLTRIFFKGNTGYITGDFALLKSTDNGETWFQLYLPTEAIYVTPITAFFLDESRGFVTLGDGSLFYTDDGGRSWDTRIKGNSSEVLHDPWFFDENNGFALSGGSNLKKTVNGGKTWDYVNVVQSPPQWTSLFFLNDKDGFITSFYKLYRTKDGGKTWTEVPDVFYGDALYRIEFTDNKNGYLFGGSYSSALITTADGGNSWELKTLYAGYGGISGITKSSTGKLFTAHRGYSGLGRSINYSVDDGATWTPLDELQTEDFFKVDFITEDVGLLISQSGQYKTTNKGMTWKKFYWPKPVYNFHYFDENNALLSDGYIIYKTTDGGVTMNEVLVTTSSPDPYYAPAGQLYAVTDDLIFSYSDYSLYRSLDGGDHWQLMGYDYDFYARDMHLLSANVGYRMELFGSIEKTVDGGTTWELIFERHPLSSDPYHSIFFVNENIGYKAGKKFAKTTDGGVTWTTIYTNFIGDVFDLYFSDQLHGYAATRYKQLYETFDGGLTWNEIFLGSSWQQDGLSSIQHKHGNIYLAGAGGFIGQVNNTGKKPVQPGYVVGPEVVCAGDTHAYFLSNNYSVNYQWNVSGAVVNDEGARAYVHFPNAGDYTFTINNSNECGVSEPRVQTVNVIKLPELEFTGPEMVETMAPVRYDVTNVDDDLQFQWKITGAKSFTNESVPYSTVTWDANTSEDAAVQVFVSDPSSGCSLTGRLDVTLEIVLGVEEQIEEVITIYPNPTPSEVTVKSRINEPLVITLYSSGGEQYFTNELAPAVESKLQLQHLPAGLYLLEITNTKGNKITKKIIKQ